MMFNDPLAFDDSLMLNDPLSMFPLPEYLIRRFPKFGEAVLQGQQNFQVPPELSMVAALATISAASQRLIDVLTPSGQRIPVALALMLFALSGERKSSVMRRFMKALYAFDEVMYQQYKTLLQSYNADLEDWKARKRALQRELRVAKRDQLDCEWIEKEIADHIAEEPAFPVQFQLVYEDVSPLALLEALSAHGTAALISSEGSVIVKSKAFDAVSQLNSAWSGDSTSVARSRRLPLRISSPRLTTCLMMQPTVLESLGRKKSDEIRDSGYLARFLMFNPRSTQGTRFSFNSTSSWDKVEAFDGRLAEILDRLQEVLAEGESEPDLIKFSPEAADFWVAHSNSIERDMAPGGKYAAASDHASKLAENIARVAALLHFFEGFEGAISLDTVKGAVEICHASSRDFMSLFVKPPEEIEDANLLNQYFNGHRAAGTRFILKNRARQCCPSRMRDNGRFYRALDVLYRNGNVQVVFDDRRKEWIDLTPGAPYYPPAMR